MIEIQTYKNGNATVTLFDDGTRIVESQDDQLKLDYPLNIDIRLSKQCSFGYNPNTSRATCNFCHESATTDGAIASCEDVQALTSVLDCLPAGVELAVGSNQISGSLFTFLEHAKTKQWIVNLTVNQGHTHRDKLALLNLIDQQLIRGLRISFRRNMRAIPDELLQYPNTVVHVISGIDNFDDVVNLKPQGVAKILVLGEKDFGFNKGKVKLTSASSREWYFRVHELFKQFTIVSFDNLGTEQLNVKRFVKDWDTVYQHEHSFYINAVDRWFARSSRSAETTEYTGAVGELQRYWNSVK